jgi:hypothetical protein
MAVFFRPEIMPQEVAEDHPSLNWSTWLERNAPDYASLTEDQVLGLARNDVGVSSWLS